MVNIVAYSNFLWIIMHFVISCHKRHHLRGRRSRLVQNVRHSTAYNDSPRLNCYTASMMDAQLSCTPFGTLLIWGIYDSLFPGLSSIPVLIPLMLYTNDLLLLLMLYAWLRRVSGMVEVSFVPCFFLSVLSFLVQEK